LAKFESCVSCFVLVSKVEKEKNLPNWSKNKEKTLHSSCSQTLAMSQTIIGRYLNVSKLSKEQKLSK
jgi:hypothetical protein